jgi:hypothetical protein
MTPIRRPVREDEGRARSRSLNEQPVGSAAGWMRSESPAASKRGGMTMMGATDFFWRLTACTMTFYMAVIGASLAFGIEPAQFG